MTDKIQEAQKLIQANKKGKVNISGKDYSTVPSRVESFRRVIKTEDIPDIPSIYTHVVTEGDKVTARAYLAENVEIIINDDGKEMVQMKNVVSVGTSEEERTANKINRTSAVEVGETSAVGRMLANLGLHGGQMASAEEVLNAQKTGNVVELRNRAGSKMKQFQETYAAKTTQTEVNEYLIEKKDFIDWLKKNDPESHRETMKQINEFKSTLPQE